MRAGQRSCLPLSIGLADALVMFPSSRAKRCWGSFSWPMSRWGDPASTSELIELANTTSVSGQAIDEGYEAVFELVGVGDARQVVKHGC